MRIGFPLEWHNADLSASDYTKWIKVPPQAKYASLGIGWTATGAPEGALTIEASNHGREGTAGATILTLTTTPSGSANSTLADLVQTSASYLLVRYARTSGGTGATWTDDSGVAGTVPVI